jgi:hypothetical protein
MALSVDVGVLGVARSQLQSAADAAALSGAAQIANYRHAQYVATMLSEARTRATNTARANRILGDPPIVTANAANSPAGQVVVGYLNPTDITSTTPSTTGSASSFNSVKVTLQRDATHGGPIPAFFSAVYGHSGTSITVSGIATMRNMQVAGFKSVNGLGPSILPIVLDKTTYDQMIAGSTTDQYEWCEINKMVYPGSDGLTESKCYPVKNGNPGNWGTIKIGVSNNSTSTLGAQIRYGITPSQLAQYPGGMLQLSPATTPPSITFEGNPGISAGIKDDLTSIIGRPVFLPIYDQTGGNGNNAWYRVIKFAGVRILDVNFQGNPKYVIVQPAMIRDATAIPSTGETSLAAGGLVRLYLSR